MDRREKLAVNQTDCLEPFLLVANPNSFNNHLVKVIEHPNSKRQAHAVLEAIGLILGWIELELHDFRLCDSHIASNKSCVQYGLSLT